VGRNKDDYGGMRGTMGVATTENAPKKLSGGATVAWMETCKKSVNHYYIPNLLEFDNGIVTGQFKEG